MFVCKGMMADVQCEDVSRGEHTQTHTHRDIIEVKRQEPVTGQTLLDVGDDEGPLLYKVSLSHSLQPRWLAVTFCSLRR